MGSKDFPWVKVNKNSILINKKGGDLGPRPFLIFEINVFLKLCPNF